MSSTDSYFDERGRPIENAPGAVAAFKQVVEEYIDVVKNRGVQGPGGDEYTVASIIRAITTAGFRVLPKSDPAPSSRRILPYPLSCFNSFGRACLGAERAHEAYDTLHEVGLDKNDLLRAITHLNRHGLVVTLQAEPLQGQIARVQIDAYGESASEVESTLLEYATRCDAASQAPEVTYGRCVIERNLEEEWGEMYSWRGRLVLHPTIGTEPDGDARIVGRIVSAGVEGADA